MFIAVQRDGTTATKGDILYDGRNDPWTFQSVTHPRKVFVTHKHDTDGPDSWPNRESREFYANVLNVGIWDTERQEWTFHPEWPKELRYMIERSLRGHTRLLKY